MPCILHRTYVLACTLFFLTTFFLATFTSYAAVPRADLVAEYLFEDNANLGLDSSGNSNNAVSSGSPSSASGKIGQALLIDELSDVLTDIPGFNRGQSTTFNLWFKTSKGGYLMQQEYWSGGTWSFLPEVKPNEGALYPWVLSLGHAVRDDIEIGKTDYDFRDNQWHMLTFITNGHWGKAYVDGQLIGEDNSSSGPSTWTQGQTNSLTRLGGACIYGFNGCSQEQNLFFDGLLDNVRIYNRELTLSEIQQLKLETFIAPPVAKADRYTLVNTETVTQLNLLANDTAESLDTVTIQVVSQKPSTGTVTVSGQSVTYRPKAGKAQLHRYVSISKALTGPN